MQRRAGRRDPPRVWVRGEQPRLLAVRAERADDDEAEARPAARPRRAGRRPARRPAASACPDAARTARGRRRRRPARPRSPTPRPRRSPDRGSRRPRAPRDRPRTATRTRSGSAPASETLTVAVVRAVARRGALGDAAREREVRARREPPRATARARADARRAAPARRRAPRGRRRAGAHRARRRRPRATRARRRRRGSPQGREQQRQRLPALSRRPLLTARPASSGASARRSDAAHEQAGARDAAPRRPAPPRGRRTASNPELGEPVGDERGERRVRVARRPPRAASRPAAGRSASPRTPDSASTHGAVAAPATRSAAATAAASSSGSTTPTTRPRADGLHAELPEPQRCRGRRAARRRWHAQRPTPRSSRSPAHRRTTPTPPSATERQRCCGGPRLDLGGPAEQCAGDRAHACGPASATDDGAQPAGEPGNDGRRAQLHADLAPADADGQVITRPARQRRARRRGGIAVLQQRRRAGAGSVARELAAGPGREQLRQPRARRAGRAGRRPAARSPPARARTSSAGSRRPRDGRDGTQPRPADDRTDREPHLDAARRRRERCALHRPVRPAARRAPHGAGRLRRAAARAADARRGGGQRMLLHRRRRPATRPSRARRSAAAARPARRWPARSRLPRLAACAQARARRVTAPRRACNAAAAKLRRRARCRSRPPTSIPVKTARQSSARYCRQTNTSARTATPTIAANSSPPAAVAVIRE